MSRGHATACRVLFRNSRRSQSREEPLAKLRVSYRVLAVGESDRLLWVCAVTRRRFPVGASPTRPSLQPEATGAVMEVTKWLKPSDSGSRIGDRASVQAAT